MIGPFLKLSLDKLVIEPMDVSKHVEVPRPVL